MGFRFRSGDLKFGYVFVRLTALGEVVCIFKLAGGFFSGGDKICLENPDIHQVSGMAMS